MQGEFFVAKDSSRGICIQLQRQCCDHSHNLASMELRSTWHCYFQHGHGDIWAGQQHRHLRKYWEVPTSRMCYDAIADALEAGSVSKQSLTHFLKKPCTCYVLHLRCRFYIHVAQARLSLMFTSAGAYVVCRPYSVPVASSRSAPHAHG